MKEEEVISGEEKFNNWQYNGKQLFEGEIGDYMDHFQDKLEYLLDEQELKSRNFLFKKLNYFEKENLKKIQPSYNGNLQNIINELKDAIILKNSWHIFYCIELLAERITDLIIKKENSKLQNDFPILKRKIIMGLKLQYKIDLLNKLYQEYNTSDFKILIAIITLIQRIRNKFMFHIKDYDDFAFIFKENINEKEKLLSKLFESIKKEMEILLKLLNDTKNIDQRMLTHYVKSFNEHINFYKSKELKNATVNNSSLYEVLPTSFADIAFIFLLFFGKEDLNLFDKGKENS